MTNRTLGAGLWAISCYFNPCRYRRRLANYHEFRRRLTAPLVCVELSFDGRFELGADDADVLIKVKGGAVLWQKERLLNIAWRHVPLSCRKIAWLDCDVFFASDDWIEGTQALLDDFPVVQPFSQVAELRRETRVERTPPLEECGLGYSILRSSAAPAEDLLASNMRLARTHSGLAWAAHRDAFDGLGFYDSCIVGSGNRAMFCAQIDKCEQAVKYLRMTPRWADHYRSWADRHFRRVNGKVGHLDMRLYHLWHGDLENRRYAERHEDFSQYAFDPERDIGTEEGGPWKWTSRKRPMHDFVCQYLKGRREDG